MKLLLFMINHTSQWAFGVCMEVNILIDWGLFKYVQIVFITIYTYVTWYYGSSNNLLQYIEYCFIARVTQWHFPVIDMEPGWR